MITMQDLLRYRDELQRIDILIRSAHPVSLMIPVMVSHSSPALPDVGSERYFTYRKNILNTCISLGLREIQPVGLAVYGMVHLARFNSVQKRISSRYQLVIQSQNGCITESTGCRLSSQPIPQAGRGITVKTAKAIGTRFPVK